MFFGSLKYSVVVCGVAVGSVVTVKTLNYFQHNTLKASVSRPRVENSELELVLVQILFRHGARTPLKIIPRIQEVAWPKNELIYDLANTKFNYNVKDLKNRVLPEETLTDNLLRGGCRMGQLTVVGQQQTFDLGKNLRRLYNNELKFIDGTFDPKTTFLRTTHIPRTIESLRCLVAGMFENIEEPVTFWTLPIQDEFLFPNWGSCSALRQYIKYCFKTGDKLPGYQADLDKFFDMIGGPVPRLTFIDIFDDLSCRRAHNKPFPERINQFWTTIEKRSFQLLSESYLSPPPWAKNLVLPLAAGKMAQDLFNNMKNKVASNNPYKLYLFSVHDTSIISFLCLLGFSFDKWPPFASYVSLELYKDKNEEYFVRMLYSGKVVKLKDCNKTVIPLSQFQKMVSPYFINDFETACKTVLHPPAS